MIVYNLLKPNHYCFFVDRFKEIAVKKSMRFVTLWAVLGALLLGAFSSVAQDETVLVIGHSESTDSYDPAVGFTQTSGFVIKASYETLVTFPADSAAEILPALAASWVISEDGLSYTFTLREGAVFASGNPVTAADVVFSIKRLQNKDASPSFLADSIADVVANEDGTVTISIAALNPAFLSVLANGAFSITDSVAIMAQGGTDAADAATTDTATEALDQVSAGSGAYILESWTPQDLTVLVRNPNYGGEAPYFDRVIVTNIPEAAAQQAALEAGDIDLALDLTSDQISTLTGNADIAISSAPANIVHFLIMNNDPEIGGIVSDPRVQRAIRLALDYDGYKALWGGVQPAANLPFGLVGSLGEDQAIIRDLDAARALLAEAGYPDGFEITLDYPDFSFQGVNMNTNAQKIQSDLAEIGIVVTLNPQELQVALEAYRGGLAGFGYWFWGPDILDASDFFSFLPGGKVASERANWDVADADLQALLDVATVSTDATERADVFGQLQLYAQQISPFAPFNQPQIQTAYRANIQGYVWHPQWLIDVALISRSE
jgi:peptide/nickel transport system substrate-binding protein